MFAFIAPKLCLLFPLLPWPDPLALGYRNSFPLLWFLRALVDVPARRQYRSQVILSSAGTCGDMDSGVWGLLHRHRALLLRVAHHEKSRKQYHLPLTFSWVCHGAGSSYHGPVRLTAGKTSIHHALHHWRHDWCGIVQWKSQVH